MSANTTIQNLERPAEIPSLTGLRFVAALFVVIYHYYHLHASPTNTPFTSFLSRYLAFLPHSYLMVDFFFILSGFVLSHVYYTPLKSNTFSTYDFLSKRIARIYPLHILTLLVMLLGTYALSGSSEESRAKVPATQELVAQLTMTHAWGFCDRGVLNIPSWSISAEWFAYLCFPLAAYSIYILPSPLSVLVSLFWFLAISYYSYLTGTELTLRNHDWGILRVIAEFPIGMSLYCLYKSHPVSFPQYYFWIASLLTLALMSFSISPTIIIPLLGAVTYLAASAERRTRVSIVSSEWCVYGGIISYSLYLWHAPILAIASKFFLKLGIHPDTSANDIAVGATIIFAIIFSAMSYELYESPARRILTRYFKYFSTNTAAKETTEART